MSVTAARYGQVAKVYVKTLRDRAISPQMQQLMIERHGAEIDDEPHDMCGRTFELSRDELAGARGDRPARRRAGG